VVQKSGFTVSVIVISFFSFLSYLSAIVSSSLILCYDIRFGIPFHFIPFTLSSSFAPSWHLISLPNTYLISDDVKSTRSPLYDWVLLLGGTNDIGWGKPVQVIHDALVRVSDIPLSKGAKVLLFTVPETAYKSPAFDAKRDELNRLIKADSRDGVFVFDLHAKIPYHSMDEKERKEIWDDRLHLTSKGYERMGELVAERLFELLDAE
jgi:hypothetical protein